MRKSEATTYGPHCRKGFLGSFDVGLVHKPVSIQESLKIPDAKAAVDKNGKNFRKIFSHPSGEERWEKQFTSRIWWTSANWRTPNLQNTSRNTMSVLCSLEATSKTKKDTEQCSQSKGLQRLRWQRQSSWTLSQSFLVWLEKQVTPFQRTPRSEWPKLPDCYGCRKKNVLRCGSGFLHDKDQQVEITLTILWCLLKGTYVVSL